MKKIKNIFKWIGKQICNLLSLWPDLQFWRLYIKKLISFSVSLKIYMLGIVTYLLLIDKVSDTVWSTVFLGIALGRIVEKKIYSDNLNKDPDMPDSLPEAMGE